MTEPAWGIRPVLFHIGTVSVEAYPFFLSLALLTGLAIYFGQLRRDAVRSPDALYIVLFALIGGTIGSKLPIVVMYWKEIAASKASLAGLLSGRTIVGGLIGGAAGTFLAKKIFGIKRRMGNQIAIPVAAAMAVGRLGCLFRGCCYGQPTNLPWALDFGDHIGRHPTQLYELLFDLALAAFLIREKKRESEPGALFRLFLNCYLTFRFFLEFIRVEKVALLGLTDFQLLSLVSVLFINRQVLHRLFKGKGERIS